MYDALRLYAESLPQRFAFEISRDSGLVGAVSGPAELSSTYKDDIDYAGKHGE